MQSKKKERADVQEKEREEHRQMLPLDQQPDAFDDMLSVDKDNDVIF